MSKSLRRRIRKGRQQAIKRFNKHKNRNLMAEHGVHQFVIVLDHLKPNFNIGKIFRSADAFGAHEIHLVGIDFFDPSPAMGSFKTVPAKFHEDFDACYNDLTSCGYTLYTLEPSEERLLPATSLPSKSAFILGHEEYGICFDKTEYDGIKSLKIPQFGNVESLNVSIAASVVMYEYLKQHNPKFEGRR
ncbi:MAG: TrmH family RNA methyltransferase [Desulfobacterales bacterium]|nr:TrmH family RNA methyltransferase [Desulfobacterales bacterium]